MFDATARLARRSICPCGYSLVGEDVPEGTLYQVDLTIVSPAEYECGGCHKLIPVKCVAVVRIGVPAGLMPLEVLEIFSDGKKGQTN